LSKISLTPHASGTGVFTVSSPNSSTDRTLTLPDETGTVLTDASDIDSSQVTGGVGKVIQVVNFQTGAVATGTTTVPLDDTIPQSGEGTEFMSLEITPTSTDNVLIIDINVFGSRSGSTTSIYSLFQDVVSDALASVTVASATNVTTITSFRHKMTAPSTGAHTFKVRVGNSTAVTFNFNGNNGGRLLGGVAASSITITEIAV